MKSKRAVSLRWFLLLTFLALAAVAGSASAQSDRRPPQRPGPGASAAEVRQWEGALRQWVRQSGNAKRVSGPETAGQPIMIGNRRVQLPHDAYVDQVLIGILCERGVACPQAPVYVLRRGSSTIALEAATGKIVERNLAPGQDSAFAFLDGVVQGGDAQ